MSKAERQAAWHGMDLMENGPQAEKKAKSGNLNLFLRILPFFPLFSLYFARKKGQNAQKKAQITRFCLKREKMIAREIKLLRENGPKMAREWRGPQIPFLLFIFKS